MSCRRCGASAVPTGRRWCTTCETAYDTWSRTYASDMIAAVLGGMVVVIACGMGLPLLGLDWIIAATGAFAGFATIGGLARVNRWRRRRQFVLQSIPRASLLPGPST